MVEASGLVADVDHLSLRGQLTSAASCKILWLPLNWTTRQTDQELLCEREIRSPSKRDVNYTRSQLSLQRSGICARWQWMKGTESQSQTKCIQLERNYIATISRSTADKTILAVASVHNSRFRLLITSSLVATNLRLYRSTGWSYKWIVKVSKVEAQHKKFTGEKEEERNLLKIKLNCSRN